MGNYCKTNLFKHFILLITFNMQKKTQDIIIVSIVAILVACTIGFGIYGAVKFANRNNFENSDYECGSFGNATSLSMRKVLLSAWNWMYEAEPQGENFGYFVQRCPTFTHDTDVYQNNRLSMRTDGKIFTTVSKINLYDCHGVLQYFVETGSLWQTIINTNNIWISLLLKYPNETIVAYVESNIFVVGSVDFKNVSGGTIARVDKVIEGIRWQWNYQIFDNKQINMDILVAITGKLSFMPGVFDKDDKTDVCNQFFLGTGITALILLCLLVVGIIAFLYYTFFKNRTGDSQICSV
jgi:hypothetical protein